MSGANTNVFRTVLTVMRKELRDMSFENRKETHEIFRNFQDTLLNRIAENSNSQDRQLELFKTALHYLSEKLVNSGNDFRQSCCGIRNIF